MTKLDEIVARTRVDVARRRKVTPLRDPADPEPRRPFADALRRDGLALIAEHKRASPSAGVIREDLALRDVVGCYERGGAAALSILTEGTSFGGSLDDLRAARDASTLPILRKDFIVDSYQLLESLAWGADAILLIVAALTDRELAELHRRAVELGMAALVEVHDARELDAAAAVGAELIGINNRDLSTLVVDTRTTFELLPRVPAGITIVAESGLHERAELDALERAGVDAVLIGEALMRAADIEAACLGLTANRPTMLA
jgi:indole-3-glycerol phosphate synthase